MKKKELLKRGISAAMIASMMLSLAACDNSQGSRGQRPDDPEPTEAEEEVTPTAAPTEAPETTPEPTPEPEIDYEAVYSPVLQENAKVLKNGYDMDRQYKYVSTGFMERCMYSTPDQLLGEIGYILMDLNGDDVPELLIGENADYTGSGAQSVVYGIYSCKDGQPVWALEGWARNSYSWLGGGDFYNSGSNGAMSGCFGKCHINADGTGLEWDDFYFFDEISPGQIGFYHNTEGIGDVSISEQLKISSEEFWDLDKVYKCRTIPWNMLADYGGRTGGTDMVDEFTDIISGYWYIRSYVDLKFMGMEVFPDGTWLIDEAFSPLVAPGNRAEVLGGTWEGTNGGADYYAYNLYDEDGALYQQIQITDDTDDDYQMEFQDGLCLYRSANNLVPEAEEIMSGIIGTWSFNSGAYITFDADGNFSLYDYDDNWCFDGKYIFSLGANGYYFRLHSYVGDTGFNCVADGIFTQDATGYDMLDMQFIKGLTDFTDSRAELHRKR